MENRVFESSRLSIVYGDLDGDWDGDLENF